MYIDYSRPGLQDEDEDEEDEEDEGRTLASCNRG
jgi:hypothetical protein